MADHAKVRTGKVDHIGTSGVPVSSIGILQPCSLQKDRLWDVKLSRVASDGTSQCFLSANPATGRCDGLPNPWRGRHVREWCMPSNRRYRNPAQLRFSGGVSPNKCQKRRRQQGREHDALVHIDHLPTIPREHSREQASPSIRTRKCGLETTTSRL